MNFFLILPQTLIIKKVTHHQDLQNTRPLSKLCLSRHWSWADYSHTSHRHMRSSHYHCSDCPPWTGSWVGGASGGWGSEDVSRAAASCPRDSTRPCRPYQPAHSCDNSPWRQEWCWSCGPHSCGGSQQTCTTEKTSSSRCRLEDCHTENEQHQCMLNDIQVKF